MTACRQPGHMLLRQPLEGCRRPHLSSIGKSGPRQEPALLQQRPQEHGVLSEAVGVVLDPACVELRQRGDTLLLHALNHLLTHGPVALPAAPLSLAETRLALFGRGTLVALVVNPGLDGQSAV